MASDKADFVAAIDVWSAARAWQAFRDWLNGTPDEWRGAVSRAWLSGRDYGREDVR